VGREDNGREDLARDHARALVLQGLVNPHGQDVALGTVQDTVCG
jgi:hypothetical protein